MSNLNQLILSFDHEQNFKNLDFYVSKSNEYSFKLLNSWPRWEKNIVNHCGEKYSGKSHLSEIFSKKSKSIILDANGSRKEKIILHNKFTSVYMLLVRFKFTVLDVTPFSFT